ncbi:protein SOSEKI 2 [Aristolochia californica]|uniref:protein SOSEKI 2 n=1 Tax=Aristolochia californica TaxID=171875 RepID=UPI0035D88D47
MDIRARRSREASPDRARVCMQPKMRMFRKVQVVYYLCRNGQVEHPHFMEVSHLANQQLRLKDVIDRLTVLRGRGMVSLFSWSCKRSYKNGYVWNDLSETDVVYPAEGGEYVLKGSEIIDGCAERPLVSPRHQNLEPSLPPKRKPLSPVQSRGTEEEEVAVVLEEEEKLSNSSSNTSSRCSRGVSTDETEENENTKAQNNATELPLDEAFPPSSSSTVSEKTETHNASTSQLLDYDSGSESAMTRSNSVLLQLIACGSVSARRNGSSSVTRAIKSTESRKSSSLRKGVLCKTAKSMDEEEIGYISENPRFGNPQSEEKEYFSGSIVESMTENRVDAEPSLKKSSSYNEERSGKSGLGEECEEKSTGGVAGKCIPRKKTSAKNHSWK